MGAESFPDGAWDYKSMKEFDMEMGQHLLPPGLSKNLFLYPINGVAGIGGLQHYGGRIKLWLLRKQVFVVFELFQNEEGLKWGLRRAVFCVAG